MAVSFQEYSLDASSTTEQIAAQLRQALIDAGLMSDWYDKLTGADGCVFCILRITHDDTKPYGSSFIWFVIRPNGSGINLHHSLTWNSISHQPTGVQYWDYYDTPNLTSYASNGWWSLGTSTNAFKLRRFTAADKSVTVLTSDQGGYPVTICKTPSTLPSWLDFNYCGLSTFFCSEFVTSNVLGYRGMNWYHPYLTRRHWHNNGSHYDTSSGSFARRTYGPVWYFAGTSSSTNYTNGLPLPMQTTVGHPARSVDWRPIITDLNPYPPIDFNLGADFGLVSTAGLTLLANDTLTVSGSEVWRVIDKAGNTNMIAFVARTV